MTTMSYAEALQQAQAREGSAEITDAAARALCAELTAGGDYPGSLLRLVATGRLGAPMTQAQTGPFHDELFQVFGQSTDAAERTVWGMLATWAMNGAGPEA